MTTKAYRTGTTVIVRKELTAIGQRTPKGAVARVTKDNGLMAGVPGWLTIETMETPRRFWSVKVEDVQRAAHPWGWYEMPHPYADGMEDIVR